MAGSPQHTTLVASTVTTLTFDVDFAAVEVMSVDGTAEVYFTIGATTPAPATPVVGATGTHVLPAAISGIELPVPATGPTVVKLISTGTPKVSVRGLS